MARGEVDVTAMKRMPVTGSPISAGAMSALQDRAWGVLLGAAIGDALAAPVEGAVGITEAQLVAWTRSPRVLRYTGLTATLIALAGQIAVANPHGPLDEQRLTEVLTRTRKQEPWRGYDTESGLLSWSRGPHDPDASRPAGSGGGLGAVVGVAPAAVARPKLDQVASLARSGVAPTRTGVVDDDAGVTHAVAVALAMRSDPVGAVAVHAFLERVAVRVVSIEAERSLQDVRDLARRCTPAEVSAAFGRPESVLATVSQALLAFLRGSGGFADAMDFALRVHGRTGPVAALTGAMAGGRYGASGIPVAWLARLENASRLTTLADALLCTRIAAERTTDGARSPVTPG